MKTAQVKMAENIAVLILFIFLVVLGLIFYTQYKRGDISKQQQHLELQNAIEVATRASYLPELQCSQDGLPITNCIDKYKLDAAGTDTQSIFNVQKSSTYFSILGYSTIELKQFAIDGTLSSTKNIYNSVPTDTSKFTSTNFVPVPIKIYDPITDANAFGVLEVTVYG